MIEGQEKAAPALRRAEADDAMALFQLANDPTVRGQSFNPAPIAFDDHVNWFAARLRSPQCRIWVISEDGTITGQVRYDLVDPSTVEIDIAVAPERRGEGLGSYLLAQTWQEACRELGARQARALVKLSNDVSARAFAKAGFTRSGEAGVPQEPCWVFVNSL